MTSETKYADYFSFDEVAKMINENKTFQIRFFTISQNSIQFRLSETNGSDIFNSNMQNNQQKYGNYEIRNPYRNRGMITTTTSTARTTTPTFRYPFNEDDTGHYYEFGK